MYKEGRKYVKKNNKMSNNNSKIVKNNIFINNINSVIIPMGYQYEVQNY